MQSCTDMDAVGPPVRVPLVDDAGAPVVTRGEVRYTNHRESTFDSDGTLELDPIYNRTDAIALRFRLDADSFTDWIPVDLTIQSMTDPDFNGPGCEATSYSATAKPVVVPAAAQLPAG